MLDDIWALSERIANGDGNHTFLRYAAASVQSDPLASPHKNAGRLPALRGRGARLRSRVGGLHGGFGFFEAANVERKLCSELGYFAADPLLGGGVA